MSSAPASPPHPSASFPGPDVLGRCVVVGPGQPPPSGFPADAPRLVVDANVLEDPAATVRTLHAAWASRQRHVIELAVPNEALREPEVDDRPPWRLPDGFTFLRERLAFLVWANSYDARSGPPIWWDAVLAERAGAATATPGQDGDVVLDGRPAWCDGGPRGPVAGLAASGAVDVLHRDTIRAARQDPRVRLRPDRTPTADGTTHDGLADDQREAVLHRGAAARIIAPAGSGKTRVLTARLRHLLTDRGWPSELVTAVAYNNRAAAEMRDRLTGLRADVRTLHSLGLWVCNLDVRRNLLDGREQRSILDRLVRTAKIPNQDPFQPYLDALTEVRIALRDPDVVGAEFELDDFGETFDRYRAELDRRNAIDFDEQIYHALELLLTRPDIRVQAQQRCTHLLVDEFQDLTPAFHTLVRLVASPALDVFAVGDDDQVIYGYAGADPDYLISFARDFPGAGDHPLHVNYRCPPAVVQQADRLLRHNHRRVAKEIRPGRTDMASTAAVAVHGVEVGAMASRVVTEIRTLLDAGTAPADMAVLARVNATLLPVQVALGEAGIPRSAPLDPTVVGRTGVRTALAYLRMGLDPERIRREDVWDTINRPSRKVKSAVSDLLRGPRWSLERLEALTSQLSATHADRWRDYLDDIRLLCEAITDGADTHRCLWLVRNRIGLGDAMATLDSARTRPEGSSHGDDLDALAQLASIHPRPETFRDWLVEALRVPGDDAGVTLSSVHRVKGMEWDHVVVFAANGGLFPHRLADDDEEERRVFHVAITRCRESVTVVHDAASPSPFLAELDQEPPPPTATVAAAAGPDARRTRTREQVAAQRALRPAGATSLRPSGATTADVIEKEELTGDDLRRFEALREWRTTEARSQGMPAYIVFSDATLRDIARTNPSTLVALSRCKGVGPMKLDRYGDDVLEVLADLG